MTLVNLGSFSGVTDGANASPSYLNSKFSRLLSMVTAVNSAGTDFGAITSGSTTTFPVGVRYVLNSTRSGGGVWDAAAFGVMGDNATDDTAAINSALSAAQVAGGGRVVLSGFTHRTTATIRVPSRVILEGAHGGVCIKAQDAADFSGGLVSLSNQSHAGIRNLILDGNVGSRTTAVSALGGVFLQAAQNCIVHDITIRDVGLASSPSGNALTLSVVEADAVNCEGNDIRNVHFYDNSLKIGFGVRLFTDWTVNQADSAFVRFVQGNKLSGLVFHSGVSWNCLSMEGPATRENVASDCVVLTTPANTAFDIDKGASYNVMHGMVVQSMSVNTIESQYAFRISGVDGAGSHATRFATGNQLVACRVSGLSQGAGVNVAGAFVDLARDTSIIGLSVSSISYAGANVAAAVNISSASNLAIVGGAWKNTNLGIHFTGGQSVVGMSVCGVQAAGLNGAWLIGSTGTFQGITFTGNHFSDNTAGLTLRRGVNYIGNMHTGAPITLASTWTGSFIGNEGVTLTNSALASDTIVVDRSRVDFPSGVTIHMNQSRFRSLRTVAMASLTSATVMPDEIVFAVGASGCSLALRSGGTMWYPNSSLSTVG